MTLARIVLVAALLAAPFSAQVPSITRALPEVASPGDLVILEGTNLGAVTNVRFFATVGGFVGILPVNAAPTTVTATRVSVIMPNINSYAPPNATPPGDPFGAVAVLQGATASNQLPFFMCQGSFGAVSTLGIGTTLTTGQGRPVIGFDLALGAPTAGNASFTLKLENGPAASFAFLGVGTPATPPFSGVGDGSFVIDLGQPLALVVSFVAVDAQGIAAVTLPVPGPGPFGVTGVCQWAVIDTGSGGLALSNGLVITL